MSEERLSEILSAVAEGDEGAFEELYQEYSQAILFHTRNLVVDKDSYQDVAQEIAIKLYEGVSKLREPKAFHGWMHSIIRNTCSDSNRRYLRESGRGMVAGSDGDIIDGMTDSYQDFDPVINGVMQKTDEETLFNMILALPKRYREIIILRYYDELSYSEISEVMGIAKATVGTDLMKAKNRLKKMIQGVKSPQTVIGALNMAGMGVSIESSLRYGANHLIPKSATEQFTAGVKTKLALISNESAVKTTSVAAKKIGGKLLIKGIVTGACATSVVFGGLGLASQMPDEKSATETDRISYGAAAAAKQPAKTTVTYTADAKIVFADKEGKNVRKNPVSIKAETDSVKEAEYVIINTDGDTVLSGNGTAVTGSEALANGRYKIFFTLTDVRGAKCDVSRSLYIDRGQ